MPEKEGRRLVDLFPELRDLPALPWKQTFNKGLSCLLSEVIRMIRQGPDTWRQHNGVNPDAAMAAHRAGARPGPWWGGE